jgi:hypothetical protein
VCPVDGPRRDQFPHQLRWIEAEDFGERGEPCFDQFTFAEVEPPLRLLLGSTSLPLIRQVYGERLATWEKWADLSNAAQGKHGASPATNDDIHSIIILKR